MNSRSSFVLTIGFGSLILLIAVLGFGAIRRATMIYDEMRAAQEGYLRIEAFRRGIVNDMYVADILVRDYLLDPSTDAGPNRRQELFAIRQSLQQRLDAFSESVAADASPDLKKLKNEVEGYWDSLDPIFEWTPKEKAERTWVFLARKVLPRRDAVMGLARAMASLNNDNLRKGGERIANGQSVLHAFLVQMTAMVLLVGLLIAILTTHRVVILERRHEAQRKKIEETQNDLRRLSNRLLQAQEGERRVLSRELHDEVGQMMTALGIELGNLEDVRLADPATFRERLADAKRLNADAMRAIRDLAMGLRPSMLDDLGLEAALQWQGREFSRHTAVPAQIQVEGSLEELTDAQSTCIYRVVQEALTNCARHAKATNVVVSVAANDDEIVVLVQDDGIGFNSRSLMRGGLGLMGIRERVQALEGKVNISSEPMKGTTIQVELPAAVAA